MYLIDAHELQQLLGTPSLRIVDCRFTLLDPQAGRRNYRGGHVPGAVYADLDRDLAAAATAGSGRHPLPSVAEAEKTLSRLGIDAATQVVVYDDAGGAIAARAWWLLRWLGHPQARILDGGIGAWQAAGYRLESGDTVVVPRAFRANVRPGMLADTAEIEAAVAAGKGSPLVDARETGRFRGEAEPIDRLAGHIPGAKNLPYVRLLDETGAWRPRGDLRAEFDSVLDDAAETDWVAMCGSGVTACHLAVTALHAGCREPRIYVGSWSAWIDDPGRPVATGDG